MYFTGDVSMCLKRAIGAESQLGFTEPFEVEMHHLYVIVDTFGQLSRLTKTAPLIFNSSADVLDSVQRI